MHTLTIGTDVISYSVVHSQRAKRMRVAISPSGVKVVLPRGWSEQEAIKFVEKVKLRVQRARERIMAKDSRLKTTTDVHYVSGARIPLLGREIGLLVCQERRRRSRLEYDGNLLVRVPAGLTAQAAEKEAKRKVEGWIKGQVHREALELTATFGKRIGILPQAIRIKAQKKLWGSCGRNAIINLNWKLGLFPRKVFEYVVAHEMAHLRHMNHSAAFWRLVGSLMPEYEKYRVWLKF